LFPEKRFSGNNVVSHAHSKQERGKQIMVNTLRQWHWNLLHRVFGLPDRDHTEPHAPLSAVLRAHRAVPAHGRHFAQPRKLSVQAQLQREMAREPRALKGWQRRIGGLFDQRAGS
jgi:hypothetical protein